MKPTRRTSVHRKTNETDLTVTVDLRGKSRFEGSVGIGFVDRMLERFARHGLFDLKVEGAGDLHIDPHHTVEVLGLTLGEESGRNRR